MDMVATDLFQHAGKHYLCMTDCYSGNCWVQKLTSLTTSTVINTLVDWFLELGLPNTIRSDKGPQFRGEFKSFCKSLNINQETSSSYYPQSNGLAESAVKSMRYLLKRCQGCYKTFKKALLVWRNTPKEYGYSPAQLFFGYAQNYGQNSLGSPFIDRTEASKAREHAKSTHNAQYNKGSLELSTLEIGDKVLLRNPKTHEFDTEGEITAKRRSGRSYNVSTKDDFETIRNRRDLIPILP